MNTDVSVKSQRCKKSTGYQVNIEISQHLQKGEIICYIFVTEENTIISYKRHGKFSQGC